MTAGLGLYIVKRLVEMHGGAVHAADRREGGPCVRFSISFCLAEYQNEKLNLC